MAAGLEPERTSVIRVMTPHPDTVQSSMTILDALKKMHDNRYLHLPVVDDHGQMAGLVDVLQVSFAMLNQMSTIQNDGTGNEGQGPVWNKFWESSFAREETGSEISASDARSGFTPALYGGGTGSTMDSSVLPPISSLDETGSEFTFKFKEPSGQVHRFGSSTRSFAELHDKIVEKMGSGLESGSDVVLSYCDEENDQVLLLTDSDIVEAVEMAYRNQWPLIRLSVTTSTSKKAAKTTTAAGADVQGTIAGLNPIIVSGAVGLGVGVVIALAIGLMKK
jgi:CBS domain-containing protein